jgi:hypothetical protein
MACDDLLREWFFCNRLNEDRIFYVRSTQRPSQIAAWGTSLVPESFLTWAEPAAQSAAGSLTNSPNDLALNFTDLQALHDSASYL